MLMSKSVSDQTLFQHPGFADLCQSRYSREVNDRFQTQNLRKQAFQLMHRGAF